MRARLWRKGYVDQTLSAANHVDNVKAMTPATNWDSASHLNVYQIVAKGYVDQTLSAVNPCGSCDLGYACDEGQGTCELNLPFCEDGWCLIPQGPFRIGAFPDEACRNVTEAPQHWVTITNSFWMQQTEVTQGQWTDLIGVNPSYFDECGKDCPIEMVTWYDAIYYANKLSEKEGLEACYKLANCSGEVTNNLVCEVSFIGVDCEGSPAHRG